MTPVGPYGAHERLQHSPPHAGTPASFKTTPPSMTLAPAPHTSPAPRQPVVPGACGCVQVPTVAPEAMLQMPVQHWPLALQTSPSCVQNETCNAQFPPLHSLEQQSVLAVQVLPEVLQVPLSGMQTLPPASPAAQVPLQHSALLEHVWLSEVQAPAQAPLTQLRPQQSVAVEHDSPSPWQPPGGLMQTFKVGSQLLVQHSPLLAQLLPEDLQFGFASPPVAPVPPPAVPPVPPFPSCETSPPASFFFGGVSSSLLPQPLNMATPITTLAAKLSPRN